MKYKKNRILTLSNSNNLDYLNNTSNINIRPNSKKESLYNKIRAYTDLPHSNSIYNNYNKNNFINNSNIITARDMPISQKMLDLNLKDEPFDNIQSNYVYATTRKKISTQNFQRLNRHLNNSNSVYYNTINNTPHFNEKQKIKNIPKLNFVKINNFYTNISDYGTDNEFNNHYTKYTTINASKNNNNKLARNKLVISLNNSLNNFNYMNNNNNNSVPYFQLNKTTNDEKVKTNFSTDKNNNDFHNYIRMGSYFSNSHSKKKDKYDTVVNNGSQSDRLRNKVSFEDRLRNINPLNIRERINDMRQNKNKSQNFGRLGPNNTQRNFYDYRNFDYNKDIDINLNDNFDLNDYLAHKPRNISQIFDDRIKRTRISNITDNNSNNNNDFIYTKKIEKSNTKTIRVNHTANNSINYDNSIKKSINNENNNKIPKPKQFININQKQNSKILVIKKKNKKNTNKNSGNLSITSFEINFYSSINEDKNEEIKKYRKNNTKISYFLIKKKNGKNSFEMEINDRNMKIINFYLKDKKIELNRINEINELRQKNQQLKNELKQMKDNILLYQKQNEKLKEENTKLKMERK